MRKEFEKNIPKDCQKAMRELQRLKVDRLLARDYEETFTDIWWLVLHEVDLYADGEFGQGDEFEQNCPEAMNIRSARSADAWLIRWRELAGKYSDQKYYSDYYFTCHTTYGDPEYFYNYTGQIF